MLHFRADSTGAQKSNLLRNKDLEPGRGLEPRTCGLRRQVSELGLKNIKVLQARWRASRDAGSSATQARSGEELLAALDSNRRVFVVFSLLEETVSGEPCSLTSGDVVRRTGDTPDHDNAVAVQVLASKDSDCAMGSTTRIRLTELNDMQNHFHEQVEAGLKMLSENQGKDGLPTAPPPNPRVVPEGMAAPDPMAAAELRKQEQEAEQAEKDVQQEVSSDSGTNY